MSQKKTTFTERARWDGFFALDRLRGGTVRRKLEQDRYAWKHGTSFAETDQRIRDLIRHAVATTDYYRDYDPEIPLNDLPVVNKDTFRNNYDAFRSVQYLHASDNRIMSTSGSTGTPLAMVQDHHKALCNTADSIFLGTLGRYHIGEKMAFIRVWVNNVRKGKVQLMMENSIMMDSASLSDDSIAKMLGILKKQKVKCLIGYSSALGEISEYIRRSGTDMSGFSVHAILPISEAMPDPIRAQLAEQFQCPVQAWYSNEENGIMGIQSADSTAYYINSESYHYEILKMDSNEPAEDGELGRIVITDLTNYAFPIIRYDNGDTAIAHRKVRGDRYKLYLTELYGRRSDMLYDTAGNAVTPYVITNNLWDVPGVKQYQFVQYSAKKYELRLNGDPEKMDVTDILGRIQPAFGADAEIKIKYVDEIPVLASGKRKYIENLMPGYDSKTAAR